MQGRVVKGDPIQHGVVSRPGKGIIFGPADHSRQAGGNRLTADLGGAGVGERVSVELWFVERIS